MRIVAAGMHVPVLRRIREACFLRNVQRIHIRTQRNAYAIPAGDDGGNAAVLFIRSIAAYAHAFERLPHKRGGLRQNPARFGHPVQSAIPCGYLRRERARLLKQFFHFYSVFLPVRWRFHLGLLQPKKAGAAARMVSFGL